MATSAPRSAWYTASGLSSNQPIVFRCGLSTEAYCCTPFSTYRVGAMVSISTSAIGVNVE
jgi:hypothetical protein